MNHEFLYPLHTGFEQFLGCTKGWPNQRIQPMFYYFKEINFPRYCKTDFNGQNGNAIVYFKLLPCFLGIFHNLKLVQEQCVFFYVLLCSLRPFSGQAAFDPFGSRNTTTASDPFSSINAKFDPFAAFGQNSVSFALLLRLLCFMFERFFDCYG